MNNLTYLYDWRKDLCITLAIGDNCDLNRLLYMHCPSTKDVQAGKSERANRDGLITQLKTKLNEELASGGSPASLKSTFDHTRLYLKWVDKHAEDAFTQESLEGYFEHLYQRVLRHDLKRTTYISHRSNMATILKYVELPTDWFDNVPVVSKDDGEPFEAYSRSDLNQLLPFLRTLFKQTSKQLLKDPEKHMSAPRSTPTMTFKWKGDSHKLYGGISKLMASATFLLAYYTYANTTTLLRLKRPKGASFSTQDRWHTMPAFKRRAFKVIHVEMGEHNLDIPKYSMQFFDTLLEVSKKIDESDNALLLQTCIYHKKSPVNGALLQSFNNRWLKKYFPLTDNRGRELRPVISRFRETGSQLTSYHQGDIAQGIVLDNTPNVRRKHYSKGNKHENQAMTQETILIRQEQAWSRTSPKEAREALKINVLTLEEYQKRMMPNLTNTAHGMHCSNAFGDKSDKFNRKASQHHLKQGEKLACAELLECFGCEHQVIVQSVDDIWCLLSFKECIEESLYLHLDTLHYKKNFEKTVNFISNIIIPSLNKSIVKQAEIRLHEEGFHPLWQEADSIINITKVTPL